MDTIAFELLGVACAGFLAFVAWLAIWPRH
jgi:hypothetical protein